MSAIKKLLEMPNKHLGRNHAVNETQCDLKDFFNHSTTQITEKYLSLGKCAPKANDLPEKISDVIYYHSSRVPETYHRAKGDRYAKH